MEGLTSIHTLVLGTLSYYDRKLYYKDGTKYYNAITSLLREITESWERLLMLVTGLHRGTYFIADRFILYSQSQNATVFSVLIQLYLYFSNEKGNKTFSMEI